MFLHLDLKYWRLNNMPIYILLQEGSKRSVVVEVHADTGEQCHLIIENKYLEYFIGG